MSLMSGMDLFKAGFDRSFPLAGLIAANNTQEPPT
jgi:hypothetical protein